MLKGNISVTTSEEEVMKNASTNVIICISGETHNYRQMIDASNAMEASILLPPHDALSAELDNNMQDFEAIYYSYLSTNNMASEIIAMILRVLYNGKNIMFYLTKSESEMAYMKYFIEYFRRYLGIIISVEGSPCAFDINYAPVVLTAMLIKDLFEPVPYLMLYPDNKPLPGEAIAKLSKIMNPVLKSYTPESYILYFNEYRRNLKDAGKPLVSPFIRG